MTEPKAGAHLQVDSHGAGVKVVKSMEREGWKHQCSAMKARAEVLEGKSEIIEVRSLNQEQGPRLLGGSEYFKGAVC